MFVDKYQILSNHVAELLYHQLPTTTPKTFNLTELKMLQAEAEAAALKLAKLHLKAVAVPTKLPKVVGFTAEGDELCCVVHFPFTDLDTFRKLWVNL